MPIFNPRGVPEDASPEFVEISDGWGGDGHSHSYLTVRELLDYDWDQQTRLCGWVGEEEYVKWRDKGSPSSWVGGISGQCVKHVTNEEMEQHICEKQAHVPQAHSADAVFTEVSWGTSYRECASVFLEETLPALQELGPSKDVRIVFFFDN